MKKLVALMLVFCLATMATAALSDGYDFSAMTLDELQQMREAIEEEIAKRSTPLISNGVFIGGKSIVPGTYVFYGGKENMDYEVFSDEQQFANVTWPSDSGRVDAYGSFIVTITDGMVVTVENFASMGLYKDEWTVDPLGD